MGELTKSRNGALPLLGDHQLPNAAVELAGRDGVVLCFGSLYSIGAIRDALDEMQAEGTSV